MPIVGAFMGFLLISGAMSAMPTQAAAPALPELPHYPVTVTAYNAVPEQTDSDPFTTASGLYSNPEIVAARSRDLAEELPFGTIVEIDGPTGHNNSCGYTVVEPIVGYRIIADTMNARYTNRIDILFNTKSNYLMGNGSTLNAGMVLGICSGSTVRVVGRVDMSHPNKIPKTQEALAAYVKNGGVPEPLAVK